MKRNFLFLPLMATLLLTGCSSEDNIPDGDNDGDGKATTSYMTVNLVTSDASETRAATGYEDGTKAENKINAVRFYFFNGLGGAVNVKHSSTGYVNYYDWTPTEKDPVADTDDIEKILSATIVINTTEGDAVPQRIAAVINPPTINGEKLLPNNSMSLSELKAKTADFATADLTSEGKFVMYNSVGGGGKDLSTTLIEAGNLCATADDAEKNPVTIYVERSVAKVKVLLNLSTATAGSTDPDDFNADTKTLKLKKSKSATGTSEEYLTVKSGDSEQQVYLKLEGWDLTAETSLGRLVKKINPNWQGTWWFAVYRTFWAINSMSAANEYFDYPSINTQFGDNYALYTNENAQTNDIDASIQPGAKNKTKVIIKGTLCNEQGNALTVVRHLGNHFVDDNNLTDLKKSILNQLSASGKNYYFETTDDNSKKIKQQIGTDDITIVPADQVANEGSKNNCYVYAKLTDAAKAKTWYTSSAATATVGSTEIDDNLKDKSIVDKALVWKDGKTYYYYEIKHLENEIGVVRNHIYETTVTKILGLGTPVYDPSLIIYPEQPDKDDQYIAAQVKVLSWRVVKNNYELTW